MEEPIETTKQRTSRIRSIYICLSSIFVCALGFSINLTGVFPYLEQLSPSIQREQVLNRYGWVVAINPFGQMIMSIFLGYIYNKMGSLRVLSIGCSIVFIMGSTLYSMATLFKSDDMRFASLLVARFMTGSAGGIVAPIRAYIASATFTSERTMYLSAAASSQTFGFIIGPAIQATLTPLQCASPSDKTESYIAFDMFTVAGWLSVTMGVISFILFLPGIFEPHDVSEVEKAEILRNSDDESSKLPKPDTLAAITLSLIFFVCQASFVLLETLATPQCMDNFGWTEENTILYLGITMAVGSLVSFVCFYTIPLLNKFMDERIIYFGFGLIPIFIGRFFAFSFGDELPPLPMNATSSIEISFKFNVPSNGECYSRSSKLPGCGYEWCSHVPVLKLWQFYTSYTFGALGLPYGVALSASILSKVLGPRPQGLWMGLFTSFGSLARVSGPIVVSYIYNKYGTNITNLVSVLVTLFPIILALFLYKRLVPMIPEKSSSKIIQAYENEGADVLQMTHL